MMTWVRCNKVKQFDGGTEICLFIAFIIIIIIIIIIITVVVVIVRPYL